MYIWVLDLKWIFFCIVLAPFCSWNKTGHSLIIRHFGECNYFDFNHSGSSNIRNKRYNKRVINQHSGHNSSIILLTGRPLIDFSYQFLVFSSKFNIQAAFPWSPFTLKNSHSCPSPEILKALWQSVPHTIEVVSSIWQFFPRPHKRSQQYTTTQIFCNQLATSAEISSWISRSPTRMPKCSMKLGARCGATDIVCAWSSSLHDLRQAPKLNVITACTILMWFVDGRIPVHPGLCIICLFSSDPLHPRDAIIHSHFPDCDCLWCVNNNHSFTKSQDKI